jgi:transposase
MGRVGAGLRFAPLSSSAPCRQLVRSSEENPISAKQSDGLSGNQILTRLRQHGYPGGVTILRDYLARAHPRRRPAFLSSEFDPGECGQIDWGSAGMVNVGNTRRRMSFFVMVLGYSRMLYVEFTLSQKMEHFLACLKNALSYFKGCPKKIMVDNMKTAVLSHPLGQMPVYHPRFLDMASHYGFEPRACNVRAPHEKGRVEVAVKYIKGNFLNGLQISEFSGINPAARIWMEEVANVRKHAKAKKRPVDLFVDERACLRNLPGNGYDIGVTRPVIANSQFRIVVDTNRYSVPSEYASTRCTLRSYPNQLLIYHQHKLIARHVRSYDRNCDFLDPDHQRELLLQRRKARDQQLLAHLLRLSPKAEEFYHQLLERRINAKVHIRKIVALAEIYPREDVGRAIEDAIHFQAFSSEYIVNILQQRTRKLPAPGALHLTRREDLLDLDIPDPDLSIYDQGELLDEFSKED